MLATQSQRRSATAKCILPAVVLLLLAACSSGGAMLPNKLDPQTGVTVTFSGTPLVFYRDESGRAAHARNYVHLGPLEVNRSGSYRYFLWLGIWNTMQDAAVVGSRDGFESIVIFADGEPLSLDVSGWTPAAIGASESAYLKPVSSAADAYYEVTVDHLRLIAASGDLRLQTTGSSPRNFELWNQQSAARADLRVFLEQSVY